MTDLKVRGYRVLRPIGEGGMGSVFEAQEETTGRAVALKVLKSADDTNAVNRFYREARLLADLEHPNVVRLLDFGVGSFGAKIVPYLAMELLDQPLDLTTAWEKQQNLPWLRERMGELLSALDYVHRRRTVHRDIKPSNLAITSERGLVLLDFGIAIQQDFDATRLTSTGQAVGTVLYMAPEQMLARPVDARADLYAVGMVLLSLLAGRHPLRELDSFSVMRMYLEGLDVLQAMTTGRAAPALTPIPEEFFPLLQRLLRVDPANRAASAAEALGLMEVCGELPAEGPPLAGREDVRRELLERLQHAHDGRGSAVVLWGARYTGKSRLLEELQREARREGMACITSAADVLGHVAEPKEIHRMLAGRSRIEPFVLCLDDVSWEDPQMVALFTTANRYAGGKRCLVVMASASPPPLRESRAIALGPLPEAAAIALVQALARREIPLAMQSWILEQSGGLPGWIVAVMKLLGSEVPHDWTALPGAEKLLEQLVAPARPLPNRLQAALGAAGVLGPRFPLTTLHALLTATPEPLFAPSIAPGELATELASLTPWLVVGEECVFQPGLMAAAATHLLPASEVREWHEKAAFVHGQISAETRAAHLEAAEDWEGLLQFVTEEAERAVVVGDIPLLRRLLPPYLPRIRNQQDDVASPTLAILAVAEAAAGERTSARALVGESLSRSQHLIARMRSRTLCWAAKALIDVGDAPGARELLHQAESMYPPEDDMAAFSVHYGIASLHRHGEASAQEALTRVQHALDHAANLLPRFRMLALQLLAFLYQHEGDMDRFDEANLAAAQLAGGTAEHCAILNNLGVMRSWMREDWESGAELFEQAIHVGRDFQDPNLIHPLLNLGVIRARQGQYDAALQLLDEVEQMASKRKFQNILDEVMLARARAALAVWAPGAGELLSAEVDFQDVGVRSEWLYLKGQLALRVGRPRDAEPHFDEALRMAGKRDADHCWFAWRGLAQVAARTQDIDALPGCLDAMAMLQNEPIERATERESMRAGLMAVWHLLKDQPSRGIDEARRCLRLARELKLPDFHFEMLWDLLTSLNAGPPRPALMAFAQGTAEDALRVAGWFSPTARPIARELYVKVCGLAREGKLYT
ncbi:MAG: protein kinase domain-containing protein [Candidatus Xenobia bacterium]